MASRGPGKSAGLAVASLLAALVCPTRALGFAGAEGEYGSIEAMGNVRLLGAYLVYPDVEGVYPEQDDALLGSVQRLILDGSLGEKVDYEVNLFNDLSRMPDIALGGAFATAGSFETPYRYPHLAWDWWQSGTVNGQAGVDRLRFRLDAYPVDLTLGRFPVDYSVAQIFSIKQTKNRKYDDKPRRAHWPEQERRSTSPGFHIDPDGTAINNV